MPVTQSKGTFDSINNFPIYRVFGFLDPDCARAIPDLLLCQLCDKTIDRTMHSLVLTLWRASPEDSLTNGILDMIACVVMVVGQVAGDSILRTQMRKRRERQAGLSGRGSISPDFLPSRLVSWRRNTLAK